MFWEHATRTVAIHSVHGRSTDSHALSMKCGGLSDSRDVQKNVHAVRRANFATTNRAARCRLFRVVRERQRHLGGH
jgi:hypothetical protein